jgi:mRNA interferase RelE/StbE
MKYSINFTKSAFKELEKLPKDIQSNVAEHIVQLADEPRPKGCKKLRGDENHWRIRVGNFRIVYFIEDNILTINIIRIRHRKDVYK